ncbi:hypothetical protein MMIC_P2417 [Mariprofundus micogutta]|uniref:STAS/SEC14 domain-containing protein n=1 Tax=Mariprofundus micogutta TaxID=1921010 RepID=A0A1L8CR92_9PROT|nr:hypothetical protein [Mariprofundus micogutta]GAV21428.1 hypothetical protein MMIC_P2417 [Mariprofundus micogutta]
MVSYTIDSVKQIVFTHVEGVLDNQQLHEHQDKLGEDPEFHPDMRELMDCRDLINVRVREINYSQLAASSPWGSQAQRAIVVSTVLGFGLLNIFQAVMGSEHGKLSIFRDIDSAKEWLGL